MKWKEILKNKKIKVWIFCFLVSFFLLMIVSRNSFLYAFNDWEDAHAFFTVGKSMMNGEIVYKDIFEQKGPFLYFIYGIGYLLSHTSFLGVFFLEIISSTIFLFYVHKIINLYLEEKYTYWIVPLVAGLLYGSMSFRQGGSCEEFTFPMLTTTIYYLLTTIRTKQINYKVVYGVGFLAGLIFLMKYTLLGINFAFMFYLFFMLLFQKNIKQAFLSCVIYLAGMFTPMIPWIIYFLIHGALYDFINVYVLINLFSYSEQSISIMEKLLLCFRLAYENIEKIGIPILILLGILLLFLIFSFIYPLLVIKDKIKGRKILLKLPRSNKLFSNILYIVYSITIIVTIYCLSDNTKFIGKSKKEYIPYQFKDIILEKEIPTLLNYGWLDCGFYMTTNTIPNVRYFERQNFQYSKYPENMDSQNEYIKDKKVDFVIVAVRSDRDYPITEYLETNYEMVTSAKPDYDYAIEEFILYRLKKDV